MTKLHIDALARKARHSKKAVRDALEQLPRELDLTYEDALDRIMSQDEEGAILARHVLSWTLLSFQPLTVKTLQ